MCDEALESRPRPLTSIGQAVGSRLRNANSLERWGCTAAEHVNTCVSVGRCEYAALTDRPAATRGVFTSRGSPMGKLIRKNWGRGQKLLVPGTYVTIILTAPVFAADGTAIGELAESMQLGTWAELATNGMDATISMDDSIVEFSNNLVWDSGSKRAQAPREAWPRQTNFRCRHRRHGTRNSTRPRTRSGRRSPSACSTRPIPARTPIHHVHRRVPSPSAE